MSSYRKIARQAALQETQAGSLEGVGPVGLAGVVSAPLSTVDLCGVRFHAITEVQCVKYVVREIREQRGGWIVTPNLDHLRRLVREPIYRALCEPANLVVADGSPLVWASRIQGTPLPERVTGSNLISALSAAVGAFSGRIYLLGGDDDTAREAARVLAARHNDLVVCGFESPMIPSDAAGFEIERLARRLAAARPDIVFLGLGSPKQERLITRLRPHCPATWFIGVGISFSFLAGRVQRAPYWMQALGLEWLHRLFQEPRRLFRRYLIDGVPFATQLLLTVTWRRLFARPGA